MVYNHIRVMCPCWAEAWGQAGSFKLNFSRLINCSSHYNSTALAFPCRPPRTIPHSSYFPLSFPVADITLTFSKNSPDYPQSS